MSQTASNVDIVIYSSDYCPFCIRAKKLLKSKQLNFNELVVDGNDALRAEMMKKSGRRTVPQIWINGQHIGGSDDLMALERSGQLNQMISS